MSAPVEQPDHEQRALNSNFGVVNLLTHVALHALELAIQQEAQFTEMRQAAMLDPLTGLSNRRALAEMYDGLQAGNMRRRPGSTNQPTSILILDIDHFKSINDTYGHDAGDEVLKTTTQTIDQRMRKRDMAARFGGEEFAILLPRTSMEQAAKIAEEIRGGAEKAGRVTLSAGVAAVDLRQPLEFSIKHADTALYAAKESGRNQVRQFTKLGLIANHGYFFEIED